jgi:hypothetical protein
MRQTWFRSTAPAGNTIDIVYQILTTRAALKIPACNAGNGRSGYIQLTDWDRSNSDITQQTLRTGYSTFIADETAARTAQTDGLCMSALSYEGWTNPAAPGTPSPFRYTTPLKTGQGMNLPFSPAPTISKRVATKAEVDAAKTAKNLPAGQGVFHLDEATNTINGYAPLGWVVIWSSADVKIALPIHEVETTSRFNDSSLNCAGAYRPDRLSQSTNCESTSSTSPAWGCKADSETTPTGETCTGGFGPNFTKGYFLITELEQIYSADLQATLCVTYPTAEKSTADGWVATEPATNGKWCRGVSKWNPDDPVNGLPMGDWCSTTHTRASLSASGRRSRSRPTPARNDRRAREGGRAAQNR